MTQFTDEKMSLSCPEALALFENEAAEEMSGAQELRALEHHLAQCDSCRKAVHLIRGLPVLAFAAANEVADSTYDTAIASVMDRLDAERRRENRRTLFVGGVAVAAMLLLGVALGIWHGGQSDKEDNDHSVASIAVLPCVPAPAVEVVSGVFMTWCAGSEPGTLIEDGAVRVSLRSGAVALSVDPLRPQRKSVSVETPSGEVRVKGTVFAVRFDEGEARVEVFRGVVEVIPANETEAPVVVAAGHGARVNTPSAYRLDEPVTAELVQALPVASEENNDTAKTATAESETVRGARTDRNGKAAMPSVALLIEEARSCMLEKNWECAASRYRQVQRTYPRSPEAAAALISMGKIDLRHRNNPRRALDSYQQYLNQAPDGPLAQEAMMGVADSLRSLGQKDAEASALRRFVEKFPRSTMAPAAAERLKRLENR